MNEMKLPFIKEMITSKQKYFILDNIEILDKYLLEEIVEKTIDYLDKQYASELIKEMKENLELAETDYEDIF